MTTQVFDPVKYKTTTRQQWDQAAEAWHRWDPFLKDWLGPATDAMLDLANVGAGSRILDIAAGAGEPAITIAKRVGPAGYVLATDISPKILEYAMSSAARQGATALETRVMDGEDLDLADGSFDVATSRVGLIYFPDQQRALSEIRRVLKPGGRVAAIVYTTPENNKFFSLPVSVIRRRAQLPPPLPGQPGPFSLGSPGILEEAYRRAGFHDIQVRTINAPVRMTSAADCVRFEKESFGALHTMLAGLSTSEQDAAWQEIHDELRRFEGPKSFEGPCELIVAVGVR
ncbi:MAG: class I SAM-dependent methyltransferase [Chloroflexi bacterium]|nr:class I SAM-dependent methyltransferase [Chloroflexota bacterium]